jgi:hypothetical protein
MEVQGVSVGIRKIIMVSGVVQEVPVPVPREGQRTYPMWVQGVSVGNRKIIMVPGLVQEVPVLVP